MTKPAAITSIIFGCVSLIWLQVAQAESMVPPYCKCNDDCKYKWPYTGICQPGYGSAYCSWSGTGIPCDGGMPKPDMATKCNCDKDCYGGMVCAMLSSGVRVCSVYGPGTPCDGGIKGDVIKKDILDAGPPLHPCSCNKDCSYYGLLCNTTASGAFCISGGPGIPCPPDIGFWRESDPWYDDMWWPRDYVEAGLHRDGDPNANLAPRTGCSLGTSGLTGSSAAPGLVVLLMASVGLLLGLRRSR